MNKPHALRTEEEVEMFAAKVASLQIFGRSLFENLEPKAVISKLMPFMKHEHFTPGQAIFNYGKIFHKSSLLKLSIRTTFG